MPFDFLGKQSFQEFFLNHGCGLPRTCLCLLLLLVFAICSIVSPRLYAAKPIIVQADNAKKDGPELQFNWTPGEVHQYQINIKAKIEDKVEAYNANCTMSVGPSWSRLVLAQSTDKEQPTISAADAFDREFAGADESDPSQPVETATGTAFSISSKGHLLTCAHVVDGADEITVTINGKKQPATVVAQDTVNDLAVLKLKNGRVKLLTLADSDKVEIAEGVHVIGFPLAKALGGKVKVSRGALSGIMINADGKRLQIDASVNPGNSGGPVLNDCGEVIGIASSKLSGDGISGIGFAIPSNTAVKLLEDLKIDFRQAKPDRGRDLSGPQLVKQVGGGVLLVEASKSGKRSEDDVEIHFTGSVVQENKGASYRRSSYSNNSEAKMVVVDKFGNVGADTSELKLPFLSGTFPELLIDQLSEIERDTWHHQRDVVLLRSNTEEADSRSAFGYGSIYGRRFPRPSFGRPEKEKLEVLQVRERVDYQIVSEKDGVIHLERTYSLKPTGGKSEKLHIAVEGKGKIAFDKALGVPVSIKSRRKITINQGSVTIEFPVLIDCKRVPLSETTDTRLDRAVSIAEFAKKRSDRQTAASNKTQEERLKALLKKIAVDFSKSGRSNDLRQLSGMRVIPEKQPAVIKLLKEIISKSVGSYTGGEAVKALGIWGTESQIPILVKLLKTGDSSLVRKAGEALASIGGKAAVEPLVDMLTEARRSSKSQWERTLEKLGPVAEPEVLKLLLSSNDEDTVESAVDVLGKIGGKASVRPLEKLLSQAKAAEGNSSRHQSYVIERALRSVRTRAVARDIGGDTKDQPARKRPSHTLSGVDRDLQQLEEAIEKLNERGKSSVSKYSAFSTMARMTPVEAKRKEVVKLIEPSLKKGTKGIELREAVKAIGVWGDESHVKYLLRLVPHAESKELNTLFKSLGQIGNEETSDELLKVLRDEKSGFQAVVAFRKLSKETEKELASWLSSDDVYQRAKAATVLGQAGGRTAGAKLKKFLKTEGDTIAFTQAIQALAKWQVRQ